MINPKRKTQKVRRQGVLFYRYEIAEGLDISLSTFIRHCNKRRVDLAHLSFRQFLDFMYELDRLEKGRTDQRGKHKR